MSRITERGATGPLALVANGLFQQQAQSITLYGGSATDTSLNTLLGSRWDLQDGREVRLVLAGASNLAAGKVMTAPAAISAHLECAITAYTAYSNNGNQPAQVTVTLGATAVTANQYAGGYMMVNSGTGLGQIAQIQSHPAAALSTDVVITLAEGFNTALVAASSTVSLYSNPCQNVILSDHTALQQPVGVTLYPVTAANYGFIVSRGLTVCLNDGGWTTGSALSVSNGTDGAVENGVIAQGFVGYAIEAGTTAHYNAMVVLL